MEVGCRLDLDYIIDGRALWSYGARQRGFTFDDG